MKYLILLIVICVGQHNLVLAQNSLAFYISEAQKNSPLINENKNLDTINQLEIKRLKAVYTKPQIGIIANYLFSPVISIDNNTTKTILNPDNPSSYYGYDLANSNGGLYQAMLNVNQPLLNGNIYKTMMEQLEVSSLSNQNNVTLNLHDVEKAITDQYILCLKDLRQMNYANEMLDLLENQTVILKKLVAAGIYKQSDLILLKIESQNFLVQSTLSKATYRNDLMDLNILCGINDTSLVELQTQELSIQQDVSDSKFLEKYRLDSLNLVAQQKAFELKYRPQLSAFANTGLNAVRYSNLSNRLGFSVGLSFTYNLFDGNQKHLIQNKTKVFSQSISFYKSNFENQNEVRKSKLSAQLEAYNIQIEITENQLTEYEKLLTNYKKEFLTGQLSVINYITVLKSRTTAQRDYLLLLSQKQSLINTYNYWNW